MGPKALGKRRRVNRDLLAAWEEIAGPELSSHTRVRSLRRGLLTIEVDSSPLCHQLASFRREELLVALKEKVRGTEVSDLRFRAGALT
jgi:predicted nucleic acid-binding Zn ribbon protein